jgi:hypothetical protein
MKHEPAFVRAARRESYRQQAYGRRGVSVINETNRRIESLIRVVDDALTGAAVGPVGRTSHAATQEMLAEAAVARRWAREMSQEARRRA